MTVHPMSFEEFLLANGEEMLLEWTREHYQEKMPEMFTPKYLDYLKKYFIIGGMPAAVSGWIDTKDFSEVTGIQRRLLLEYQTNFGCAECQMN